MRGTHPRIIKNPCLGSNAEGFTLIELLVVIGIVIVLAALLVGGAGSVKETGKSLRCVSNERQIIVAMLSYASDNQGRLPPYTDSYDIINPYLNPPAGARIGVEYLNCPSAKGGYSYGMNYGPTAEGIGVFGYENRGGFNGSLRLSHIPNTTMIIGDASQNVIYNPENWGLYGADFVQLRHKGGFNCAFIDGSVRRVAKEEWYVAKSPLWSRP